MEDLQNGIGFLKDLPPPSQWKWISRFEKRSTGLIFHSKHQRWMKKHQETHPSREIMFCLKGNHFYGFRGENHKINPGTVLLIDKNDSHDAIYSPFQPECRDLWVHLVRPHFFCSNEILIKRRPKNVRQTGCEERGGCDVRDIYLIAITRPFAETIHLAWNYCERDLSPFNLTQLKCAIISMLIEVIARGRKPSRAPEKIAHQQSIVDEIKTYVRNHLESDLSLSSLAHIAGYDSIYFHKLFTRFTGEPLHHFINRQRLVKAKEMLSEGQKIVSIADSLGFAHSSNFCRFFKRETEETPSLWLEKKVKENSPP